VQANVIGSLSEVTRKSYRTGCIRWGNRRFGPSCWSHRCRPSHCRRRLSIRIHGVHNDVSMVGWRNTMAWRVKPPKTADYVWSLVVGRETKRGNDQRLESLGVFNPINLREETGNRTRHSFPDDTDYYVTESIKLQAWTCGIRQRNVWDIKENSGAQWWRTDWSWRLPLSAVGARARADSVTADVRKQRRDVVIQQPSAEWADEANDHESISFLYSNDAGTPLHRRVAGSTFLVPKKTACNWTFLMWGGCSFTWIFFEILNEKYWSTQSRARATESCHRSSEVRPCARTISSRDIIQHGKGYIPKYMKKHILRITAKLPKYWSILNAMREEPAKGPGS